MFRRIPQIAPLALALACNFVPLAPAGEGVRLVSAEQAADCERVGSTTSKVADRIGIFARNEGRMRDEVATLARNEAAEMGADTVVRESPLRDGRQTFGAYRCRRSAPVEAP